MCTIIIDIKEILFNNMLICIGAFYMINIFFNMSIQNTDMHRDLVRMIIFTLYFILCNKCVIFYKIKYRQNGPQQKNCTVFFELQVLPQSSMRMLGVFINFVLKFILLLEPIIVWIYSYLFHSTCKLKNY